MCLWRFGQWVQMGHDGGGSSVDCSGGAGAPQVGPRLASRRLRPGPLSPSWLNNRLMQAAGLVLHICSGEPRQIPLLGTLMGECKQENNTWVTPHGLREDTLGLRESPSWVSVSRPAKDFCDQKIEELDPNLFVCQEESAIMIYKTDIQELNCWQEEPGQLHTIPRITKKYDY